MPKEWGSTQNLKTCLLPLAFTNNFFLIFTVIVINADYSYRGEKENGSREEIRKMLHSKVSAAHAPYYILMRITCHICKCVWHSFTFAQVKNATTSVSGADCHYRLRILPKEDWNQGTIIAWAYFEKNSIRSDVDPTCIELQICLTDKLEEESMLSFVNVSSKCFDRHGWLFELVQMKPDFF